jgi:hypothetical protein
VPKNPLDLANGQQTGMPEFLPACGLRVNLTGICSSEAAMEEINLVIRSSGSFARLQASTAVSPAEFKNILEGAKQGAASYAPPGR